MSDAAKPSWIVRIPTPIWLITLVVVVLVIDFLLATPVLFKHEPAGVALIVLGFGLSAWGRLTFANQGAEIFPWSEAHSKRARSGSRATRCTSACS